MIDLLEQFLYKSLKRDYKEGESRTECAAKIKKIPFVHMYGRLDSLPWEVNGGRIYGQQCSNNQLFGISKNIKLIHEIAKGKIPIRANDLIAESERVYFLGLDLRRKENLEIINLSNLEGKKIVGTAFGLENSEKKQIKQLLDKYSKMGLIRESHDTI